MNFVKMHGLGNDFIIIKDLEETINFSSEEIIQICDRHFGIGADGLMLVRPSHYYDIKMVFYNQDGTEAEMCGNGIRCFAKYVFHQGIIKKREFDIETKAGKISPKIIQDNNKQEMIQVNMGKADYNPLHIPVNINKEKVLNEKIVVKDEEITFSSLLMGVPHTIIQVEDLDNYPIREIGPMVEHHSLFPKKTNVNFVEVVNKNRVKMVTWERGVGMTLACGTGACAVASFLKEKKIIEDEVFIELPGGTLIINFKDGNIFMKGPAQEVFRGTIDL